MPEQGALTAKELDELDRFLRDTGGSDESMDVAMLDGFFAALLSGPTTILPSEWMRWVWDTKTGEGSPVFASMDEARRVMGLLMRHMNGIAMTLLEAPKRYEPLIMESRGNGDAVPVIDKWCAGFMKGVSLDPEGWLPITIGHPEWMSTFVLCGTEEGWEVRKQKDVSIEVQRILATGLGQTVQKIHAHFLDQRRARAATGNPPVIRRQPVRNAGKVGRNDPCPCGSGKKFKLCHGGSQALH